MKFENINFKGKNYECRVITDPDNGDVLIAPLNLANDMLLYKDDKEVDNTDNGICYYADDEEMKLSNSNLFNLIYN